MVRSWSPWSESWGFDNRISNPALMLQYERSCVLMQAGYITTINVIATNKVLNLHKAGKEFLCSIKLQTHPHRCGWAFSAWTLLVGRQEEHLAGKNKLMRCWHGYLSAARCKWLHFAWGIAKAKCILAMAVCVSVCLSLAAFPHYCTDPDVSWGNGRGAI